MVLLGKYPLVIAFFTISVNVDEVVPLDSLVEFESFDEIGVTNEFDGNEEDLDMSGATASANGVHRRVAIDDELLLERLGAERTNES